MFVGLQNNAAKAALLLLLLLGACSTSSTPLTPVSEQVALKLGWHHGIQFLGFYVAQDNGYYAEEGLDISVEALDDPAESALTPGLVVAGEFDFAIGRADAQHAQSEGAALTVIAAMYQFSPDVFFARADSGIVTPADLAGHSVVVKTEGWRDRLESLLAREGLTLDDVEEVSGGFDMTPFLEGDVDVWAGFVTNEVIRARQQGLELVTLPLHEYGLSENTVVVYTSQAKLDTNFDQTERFMRATIRGWQWAAENPAEAVDVLLERFPEMADERDFHLASFEASIPLIIPDGTRLGEIDCPAWEAHELFAELETTEGLCSTEILEAATG